MIPKYHQIMHPLLVLTQKSAQSRKSATKTLAPHFKLTEKELQKMLPSGSSPVFHNRVGWAFTYLTKAEYIELSEEKATYRITKAGSEALKNANDNNLTINHKYLQENSVNYDKNWQVKSSASINDNENDKDDDGGINLEQEIDKVNDEFDFKLLERIKNMSWQEFEDFCATLLEKMGYGVASTRTIRSGDGGIDGEIYEDELGLKGKIYIQAKKWNNNNIQPKDIKEFLYNVRGQKGVFITTSDFSKKAEEEAQNYKEGKVALINYSYLIKLCKKYQLLCRQKPLHIYQLD